MRITRYDFLSVVTRKLNPGSLWRSIAQPRTTLVRVVGASTTNVSYELVGTPDSRQRTTWVDTFLRRFEPESPTPVKVIVANVRKAAKEGRTFALLPEHARSLLRVLHLRATAAILDLERTVRESGLGEVCTIVHDEAVVLTVTKPTEEQVNLLRRLAPRFASLQKRIPVRIVFGVEALATSSIDSKSIVGTSTQERS